MKILLFITITVLAKICCGQDSTAAAYINDVIQKIESRLSAEIVETKDTTIFDEDDVRQTGPALTVHTEFYTNPQTMLLDKIVERSLYKKTSTELTIFFSNNQPVRFTNKQWEGSAVRFDFDIYYINNSPVHVCKRNALKTNPDGDAYLKWCYDLRKEYFEIVEEYNQTFAGLKSHQGRLK